MLPLASATSSGTVPRAGTRVRSPPLSSEVYPGLSAREHQPKMASHGGDPEGGGPREHEFTRGQSQSRHGHTPTSISLPPNICTISVRFSHQKEGEELFLTPMGFILIPSSQFVRQRFLHGLLEGEPGQQPWLLAGLHLVALGNASIDP